MGKNKPTEHTYNGLRVIELHRERIPGGVAVWVRRHPDEKNWTSTVSEFSTSLENLKPAE